MFACFLTEGPGKGRIVQSSITHTGRRRCRAALLLALAVIVAACAPGVPPLASSVPPAPLTETAYVFRVSWHAGIVVARRDISPSAIPEIADFPEATYLEFGWGDLDYYRADDPGPFTALKAGLLPSRSVMHMAAFDALPRAGDRLVVLPLSRAELARLISEIGGSFARPSADQPALPLGPGLYGQSLFYAAHGPFHVFNTCNTWVARKIAAAGVELSATGVVTATQLFERLRGLSRVPRRETAPPDGGPANADGYKSP